MKLISYSLFNATCEPFEKMAYIRGAYWNFRMNNFLYPDWRSHLEVQRIVFEEFKGLFDWLVENNNLSLTINDGYPALCAGMLWRMKPIWTQDVSHVLCRDSDAITTYKEAQIVQRWLQDGQAVLSIHDNPSHSGLMGGMVGFETSTFKALTGLQSWEEMIAGRDLSERGSDQHLLNQKIYPSVQYNLVTYMDSPSGRIPQVDPKLWESNLTCRHIGSAGVVDIETIRFFKRFDIYQWKFNAIEKQFPKIFYWHL